MITNFRSTSDSKNWREGYGDNSNNVTPITYYPLSMQRQFVENCSDSHGKLYEKFFKRELKVPVDMMKLLQYGPLVPELTIQPDKQGLRCLLENLDDFPITGYGLIEEQGLCAYAQSRHILTNVTTDMLKWWFCWHPVESERYHLWFPHAHIHNSVADTNRLMDGKLTYEERLYDNPNHIIEYIGDNYLDGVIYFDHPKNFGLDDALMKEQGFSFNASGFICPFDSPDTPLVMMIHIGRDTPNGVELINRYWIGTHNSWDRFERFDNGGQLSKKYLECYGMDKDYLEKFAYEMSVHDMTEFYTLGSFLPKLYNEFNNDINK